MKSKNRTITRLRNGLATVMAMLLLNTVYVSPARAAPLDLSDVPLDVHIGVPPNILLTMDDSGSMAWSFLPDGISSDDEEERGAASAFNAMYYNPEITYEPAVDEFGASLGDATFTAAWEDGFDKSTCTHDLSDEYKPSWWRQDSCGHSSEMDNAPSGAETGVSDEYHAYYYEFDSTNSDCDGTVGDNDCYDPVILAGTSENFDASRERPTRTDCTGTPVTCTLAQEQQNFANWFSYYRKRHLLAKTAASMAFARLNESVRVSYQGINRDTGIPLFYPFTGSARTNFFTWLQGVDASGGTPLRNALKRAGDEFELSGINSPYAKEPGVSGTIEQECQQNFHFAFTDGFWNGASPGVGNADNPGSAVSLPTNPYGIASYSARAPYQGADSNTLADVAFEYWVRDLRTDLDNKVPVFESDASDFDGSGTVDDSDLFWNPANDPANWQHMVNYTVGLGIDGQLAFNESTYNDLVSGSVSWPTVYDDGDDDTDEDAARVDDLWHAAINSRGQYFSAKNPAELIDSFTDVLANIEARTAAATAPAPSAPRFEVGTKLFQPVYDSNDWHGNLVAFNVSDFLAGVSDPPPVWEARDELNSQHYATGREILAYNGSAGIPFEYTALAPTFSSLFTADQVNYLRGDPSNEQKNGGSFRNRNYVLGDIVNSQARYVGPPSFVFPDTLESQPYSAFLSANISRTPVLWVGANDGMLHGFDADTGEELLAYVPQAVLPNLADLTSTSYAHKFYVDGSPFHSDAFFVDDDSWRTVLVGGLNAGGQSIYALDITDPSDFDQSNAASLVLWEFTDADDADLGYTYSQPTIAKMANGRWMVIFGNGYNNTESDGAASSTGDAVLYMVDAERGPGTFYKLSTETGTAEDPTGGARPNGLSHAAPIDVDGDFVVDYIYAGDLFGNVWKFDVTDADPSNWQVFKDGGSGSPEPLFVATNRSGDPQPITSGIKVNLHPTLPGLVLNFGTGQYLETDDISDTSVQSFYGIWDRQETDISTIARGHTFEQQVLFTDRDPARGTNARITSDTDFAFFINSTLTGVPTTPSSQGYLGWHIDLVSVVEDSGSAGTPLEVIEGERVFNTPLRRGDLIIFHSVVPSISPCDNGGESWITALDATTGTRSAGTPFDFDLDGNLGVGDYIQADVDINGDGTVDSSDRVIGSSIQDDDVRSTTAMTIMLTEDGDFKTLAGDKGGSGFAGGGDGPGFGTRSDKHLLGQRSWRQLRTD